MADCWNRIGTTQLRFSPRGPVSLSPSSPGGFGAGAVVLGDAVDLPDAKGGCHQALGPHQNPQAHTTVLMTPQFSILFFFSIRVSFKNVTHGALRAIKPRQALASLPHLHSFIPSFASLGQTPSPRAPPPPQAPSGAGAPSFRCPALAVLPLGCRPKPCFHREHPHACAPRHGAFPCCVPAPLQHPHPSQGWVLRPAGSRPRNTSV